MKRLKNVLDDSNIKTDCFAYQGRSKGCSALNKLYCKTHRCSFYKSKADYDMEIELVKKRLQEVKYKGKMDFYDELDKKAE